MEAPHPYQDWYTYDEGKTIGSSGEEGGAIITDLEDFGRRFDAQAVEVA